MQDEYALQISNQLGRIVIELAAIREALERLVSQQDNQYHQEKRY